MGDNIVYQADEFAYHSTYVYHGTMFEQLGYSYNEMILQPQHSFKLLAVIT